MSNTSLEKVTAFVTRGPIQTRELLVFRHPVGGVQLPAGTVEDGEPAQTAVLRETWEETGLEAVTIVGSIGVETSTLTGDLRGVLRRVILREQPAYDSSATAAFSAFLGLRRGLFVRQTGALENGFAPVVYEEFDAVADGGESLPARSISGWLEADALSALVVRHFFHLTPIKPTPDAWTQTAEEWEHRFELYWVPLPANGTTVPGLIPSQAAWVTEYADCLRQT